ncbi:hypothetical protein RND81_13G145000 [Saponaria officinalis]|uniref:RanBP-type and C3HC4-type zinc finger-containing protein 1 n=1 Tax=Saponaria officinalis TaxID=3572 RepID=A0AAW1GXR1_SAPOF
MADSYGDDDYMDDDYYDDNYDDDVGDDSLEDDDVVVEETCYTVLQQSEIRKRQEQEISEISSAFFLSIGAASRLLYHFKWNVSKLLDRWFIDEAKVRDEVGLSNTTNINKSRIYNPKDDETTLCEICYDSFPLDDFNFYAADYCGHIYCVTCWNSYITTSIDGGPGCLSLRCPYPKCNGSICRDMVDKLVNDVEKEKYDRFFLRSYIEESYKRAKWCPAPGCENAIEFENGNVVYDVTCLCKHSFCWNCVEEVHRPVDCKTVSKWVLKNSSESENTSWILANSKPCPKCNRAIEKNHGCMHMTCSAPCFFEFCWLCLGDWKQHGEKTGGFYACNRYEAEKIKGVHDEDELRRRLAKKHVAKYTHYYERWASNEKSRQKAIEELETMENHKLAKLSVIWEKPETDLEFILKGWEQIVECRRVLKWTYAYGYYIPEEQSRKKEFFEYVQGEAETNLERLHQCVEKEMSSLFSLDELEFLCNEQPQNKKQKMAETLTQEQKKEREMKFMKYQEKLAGLTKVTRDYFGKVIRDLEMGLTEFDMDEDEVINSLASSSTGGLDDDLNKYDHWSCSVCTFANSNEVQVCEMCNVGAPRVATRV